MSEPHIDVGALVTGLLGQMQDVLGRRPAGDDTDVCRSCPICQLRRRGGEAEALTRLAVGAWGKVSSPATVGREPMRMLAVGDGQWPTA